MNQHAEYVSPGHPDRLADAIAESIVTAAVRQKPDALVGVEVAVHTDCVFVDGRIAAGSQPVDIEKIVRDVYRAAGYSGSWNPDPGKIRVTTDLCQGLERGQSYKIHVDVRAYWVVPDRGANVMTVVREIIGVSMGLVCEC